MQDSNQNRQFNPQKKVRDSPPSPVPEKPPAKETASNVTPGSKNEDDKRSSQPNSIDSGILQLSHIMGMSGINLRRALVSLSANKGKKTAFAEPSFGESNEVILGLLEDSKGALRLRTILGLGLQIGANRTSRDIFWSSLLQVTDTFLRRVPFPRAVTTESRGEQISPTCFRDRWHDITSPDADDRPSKSSPSIQKLQAAQEILILDTLLAYWQNKLDSDGVLEALSYLELPSQVRDTYQRRLPWNPAISLATDSPPAILIAQAAAIHREIDQTKRSLLESETLASELGKTLIERNQELEETQAALNEEISLLEKAEELNRQLAEDVKAAGSIHRHRLDELRSRYKGLLEGEFDKHLKNIQLGAEMEPPRVAVIIERVETLLRTLKKELKWLEPSE
jgi:hypothetical protein